MTIRRLRALLLTGSVLALPRVGQAQRAAVLPVDEAARDPVLALGGRFHGDTVFYAPYTFGGTPGDGFETLAVLGRNVLVRAKPTATGGWVLGQYLRSPIDYRAGFVRRHGHWWLRALVAGD